MHSDRLVVIGGVAAGMSAASRFRRNKPETEILVVQKGQYVSYGEISMSCNGMKPPG